ncbi:hypothetical protein B4102_2253 [Heyndrickxia sporothermodurans]|uniref:Uncharacterized protein n=1 Tax=Heyndrickxia sporothermodurans TaxID=46224 RepID=A0A150LFQ9_9BACI|nr:hypothetical protein B4102_2253 [Heyndrickxia sporothermodurans]
MFRKWSFAPNPLRVIVKMMNDDHTFQIFFMIYLRVKG